MFSTQKLLLKTHKSGRSCQYWSIQSCSRIHFGRCPGIFAMPSLVSLKLGVLVLCSNHRCCTLWPLGEEALVVIVTARTSPSLRGVVDDVHDCFVDRHNKKTAPSKGQAWRMNKSPCNSAYIISSFHFYRIACGNKCRSRVHHYSLWS